MFYSIVILSTVVGFLLLGFGLFIWDYMRVVVQLNFAIDELVKISNNLSDDLDHQENSTAKLWEKLDELNLLN